MIEQVYNRYYDTVGNYHWTGVHSGEHILRKGEKMSVSKWRWTEECDKRICPGDCDICSYSGNMWSIDPREIEEDYIFKWEEVRREDED